MHKQRGHEGGRAKPTPATCQTCGEKMSITRRSPDPELGLPYELVAFHCRHCGKSIEETQLVEAPLA